MKHLSIFSALICLLPIITLSQSPGYKITVKTKNYQGSTLYLGYKYGNRSYIKDTATVNYNIAIFQDNDKLEYGNYLIVEPGENRFVDFLVDGDNQRVVFTVDFAGNNPELTEVQGSVETEDLIAYTTFLAQKRKEINPMEEQLKTATDKNQRVELEKSMTAINNAVEQYQKDFIIQKPGSLLAQIIRSGLYAPMPNFTGTKEEKEMQQYLWYKKHYFDNIDLTDTRLLRTAVFYPKIDYYLEKLTVQHPDSVIIAVDKILSLVEPSADNFKFWLIDFLNRYAKSKTVGMDAVYTHLALKYYANGKAPWTDEEQLNKIVNNAKKLEPLLIGKKAPAMELETIDGTKIALYDFAAAYTILFFWNPECGHCVKSIPALQKVAEDYKEKGVKVFAVCTETGSSAKTKCLETVKENGMESFLNAIDPYLHSQFKSKYDITSTPQVFILDKDKVILSKRIGTDQVNEVLKNIGL